MGHNRRNQVAQSNQMQNDFICVFKNVGINLIKFFSHWFVILNVSYSLNVACGSRRLNIQLSTEYSKIKMQGYTILQSSWTRYFCQTNLKLSISVCLCAVEPFKQVRRSTICFDLSPALHVLVGQREAQAPHTHFKSSFILNVVTFSP